MQYSWDALQPLRRTLPRLDAIFCQYNRLLAASACAAAAGAGLEEAENARRAYVSGMEADITAALLAAGLSPEDYRPHYRCPLCQDKGYTLSADGRRVRCVCQAVQHADRKNAGVPLCSFAEFDAMARSAKPPCGTARFCSAMQSSFHKRKSRTFCCWGRRGWAKRFCFPL